MALATRCPNCQSMFRVVSDQLKLRGGLVRCGSCRHVFDAIGSLSYVDEASSVAAPAPAPAAPAPASVAEVAAPPVPAATADDRREAGVLGAPADATSPPAPAAGSKPDALAVPTLFVPDGTALQSMSEASAAAMVNGAEAPAAETASDQAADEASPAFLRGAEPRRGISIVYTAGAALLALLAAVQLAVVYRGELLLRFPESRPQLVNLCRLFGCTVGWPMRPDLLSVIGTELQAVPGTDLLELTAVIRNRAQHRVALPAVEVTLTDSQNQTVARKVFAPVDYLLSAGEPSSRIEQGLAAATDLVVHITFEARGLAVTGFTVYHFYL